MATFPTNFRSDTARIHRDHQALVPQLVELDSALDELAGSAQVFANLYSAEKVCRCGRFLAEALPEHFSREEQSLFTTVAEVSPELDEFAREMRRQHDQLRQLLSDFSRAVQALEGGDDLAASVDLVKEKGKLLAREMSEHIALEENQLGGFL